VLKDPRSWDPNTRRSPQKTRRNDGPLKRIRENNHKGTTEMLGSRWEIITPVRDV